MLCCLIPRIFTGRSPCSQVTFRISGYDGSELEGCTPLLIFKVVAFFPEGEEAAHTRSSPRRNDEQYHQDSIRDMSS